MKKCSKVIIWSLMGSLMLLAGCVQHDKLQHVTSTAPQLTFLDSTSCRERVQDFQAACKASGQSCSAAARCLSALSADITDNLKVYEDGCTQRDGQSCSELSKMYADGLAVTKDLPKAVGFLQRACDVGFSPACFQIGVLIQEGKFLKRPIEDAATAYQQACDLHEMRGCVNLGHLDLDGNGRPKDASKAFDLFNSACANGQPRGCSSKAFLQQVGLGTAKNTEQAKASYLRACTQSDAIACSNLGFMFETEKKDRRLAATYYLRACNLADATGCSNLGVLLADRSNPDADDMTATSFLQLGCRQGEEEACQQLSVFHATGRGGLVASKKLVKLYELKACNAASVNKAASSPAEDELRSKRFAEWFDKHCVQHVTPTEKRKKATR